MKRKRRIINFQQIRTLVGQLGVVFFAAGILDYYLVASEAPHAKMLITTGATLMILSIVNWEKLR